jgi:N-acetylneuraminate synthase
VHAPYVIAEVGCNHGGDLELAKRMISVAARFCEVDAVKFQKRDPATLLTPQQYQAPHPEPRHAFGASYGEHREFLEFDIEQHAELTRCAAEHGVVYSTSVWDMPSAKAVVGMAPRFVKVPSATNQHTELLELLCAEFGGIVHLSLGMTTRAEEERIVELFRDRGRLADLVLYACTSGYPVPFEDICLLEVQRLRAAYGSDVHAVGFSGHHLGIAADVAGVGARRCVSAQQRAVQGVVADRAGEATPADGVVLAVPARNRQPGLESDIGIAGRLDRADDPAIRRQRSAGRRIRRRDGRRCDRGVS